MRKNMDLSKLPFFNIKWKIKLLRKFKYYKCLDIGAKDGKFRKCFIDYTGIDTHPKESFIIKKDIYDFKEFHYSFILMHHVLEHLKDLDKAKEIIDNITMLNSYMFIAIPNPLSPFYYDDLTHVNQMSIKAVESLFDNWTTIDKGTPILRFLPYSIQKIAFTLFPFIFHEFFILLRKK